MGGNPPSRTQSSRRIERDSVRLLRGQRRGVNLAPEGMFILSRLLTNSDRQLPDYATIPNQQPCLLVIRHRLRYPSDDSNPRDL